MSEIGDIYKAMAARRKELRAKYGVPCPWCHNVNRKRIPTLLMPGQRCKVDGYVDPREPLEE